MIEFDDVKERLAMMREGLAEMCGYLDIANRRVILEELEECAARPDFWNDANAAKEVIGKTNAQRAFVKPFDELMRLIEDGEEIGRAHV